MTSPPTVAPFAYRGYAVLAGVWLFFAVIRLFVMWGDPITWGSVLSLLSPLGFALLFGLIALNRYRRSREESLPSSELTDH